ncbi:MAG: hypothetical protein A2X13_02500 [Bacteroidetes bacterium GWC2_33_15]|nr:MAG: hypothetical protein A2X10_14945 [Bacteroidetes bacterium GWA2_33_15]OFX49365.1 MAG: hypothetical protein A2X13_02500 [Bacteroidetes bacterium GWC2_33_15]OFX63042.1 MAG: hypothetical protein A2X15_10370 [Bacteroidetes bacterium GWB2_32_14]OFX68713.1 MAG: hypothetical protein A2X14_14025 [Bacteroidetes bacterium GWD2_33_33]HAN19120.1 hypothetical protein [Bacteroidales bacterium]
MFDTQNTYKRIIIPGLIFLFAFNFNAKSQERGLLPSKYYSAKDYNSGAQNWAVIQDKRGIMYFGNVNGILEYDGENWKTIPVKNNSTVRSLAIDNKNILYSGAFNEIGCLIPNESGNLVYKSLTHLIDSQYMDFGDIWDINCFSDTVFFLTDKYLFKYHNKKFSYYSSNKERFYLSHKVDNSYFVQEIGRGLLKLEHDSLNLIEQGDFFADKKIHSIFKHKNGLIICTRTDGAFLYSRKGEQVVIRSFSEISEITKNLNNYLIKNIFYHGIEISDNLYAMSTIYGSILIVDGNWNVVDIINHESIGIVSPTHFLYYQKNQPLWLALANGICQVEINSPFRYWNDEKGINGVISDVAETKNKLYISTGSGIYCTNKNPDKINFCVNSFIPVKGTFEQTWGFLYFQPPHLYSEKKQKVSNLTVTDKTILLVASNRGLFQIIDDKSKQISDYRITFKLHQYKKDPTKLFLGLNTGLALASYNNGKWTNHGIQFGINDIIRDINEDSLGNLWLSVNYKGLIRIKNPLNENVLNNVEFYDTSNGLSSVKSNQIINVNNKLHFSSDREYYTFNYNENKFELFIHPKDTTSENVFADTLSWKRINDEIITNFYIATQEDSTTWFGTTKGTFRYIGHPDKDYFDLYPALIRKVFSGDSVLYNGTNFKKVEIHPDSTSFELLLDPNPTINTGTVLNYKNNSLTFQYASPFYEEEQKNTYSYFLDGYDKDWSVWSIENKKEYTNLPEGTYTFKVKSKNIYGIESGTAEYKFVILPPWYRTFAAYLSYFILSTLFIVLIVKLYTYNLIKEKENLEKIVKQRTQEILMQNEEILVQAEHLKDANEWISAKNIELESQKEEIEKKKDQLEISNATKNKFFRIIAHDLRSPISTFVNSTAYVLTDLDDFDKEKTKSFLSELNKLSQTTYNLLENLLDWSSSQMGEIKFNPRTFDIVSIIKENIELIKNKLESKEIELLVFVPDKLDVFADENMIHTVIRNLISNAAKFTGNKGKIEIRCTANNELCTISITDNGIGIKNEELDKLFRIDQHHTTPGTQNEKGSGLGLILCKEFIQHNGGTITVTSEHGKGSTFTFTLNIS